ncbi:E3 ubiquitin-protein ligase HOS1-like [Elaeis guineensis]|uniref:E3 ubiquitin-protein ligase HOS1 isoform X2 n=1 Tax=Elaeis guineensis var. tenera TaxID=51953 RepID=A0A6I9QBJ0_ELAGV|nr:E3 ubiquitin-protein ligase HOS1 isoform X2 [Elaeis guineensis]
MDRTRLAGRVLFSFNNDNGRAARQLPNYGNSAIQDALEHLASMDLIELCNEAKIECCRATRDLRNCGRYVQHVLDSCGHASLCAECCQRYDVCPVCRTSIPNNGARVRLRLYNKCIEAGLISKRDDDRFQEKEDSREHIMADIERLYSLFDVALENNLVSLICHYVSDVCMDENAVSSDPVLAFLLDEVVVKDWCKRTFKKIIHDLHGIYKHDLETMQSELSLLQMLALRLTGISNVLEVMYSSFKETFSGQLHDLHHLLENTLKAKQHLEVMIWCTRHQFLKNVQSRFSNSALWSLHVQERKSAAVNRSWPEFPSNLADSVRSSGFTLFIEQALSNLGMEQSYMERSKEEVDITFLQDENSPLLFHSKIDEANKDGCYPFKNLRAATDVLFLHGTSDMVVCKHAIFLYYLFDRHWTLPDGEWKYLVDDFAASFGITRHSLLESFVFYLLDDHTFPALQEASHLLPEIAGSETHPKIAQVLLERQCPDVALTVLRCTGHDGFCTYANSEHDGPQCVSLGEAVTAVRVRIECGLLTEAFIYQRLHCLKAKEEESRHESYLAFSSSSKPECWIYQVEILVTEICYLCIRRNLVDRMIELPWNSDEERYLHKCLFDHACQNPSTIYGSLLMVFYVQRYRYTEAYRVDRNLQSLEQNVLGTVDEDVASRIISISQWRAELVDKCLNLLPEVQRQKVMTTNMAGDDHFSSQDVQMTPSSTNFLPILQTNLHSLPSNEIDAYATTNSAISNVHLESASKAPSILQHKLLASLGSPTSRMNSVAADFVSSSRSRDGENSLSNNINFTDRRKQADSRQRYQSADHSVPIKFHFGSHNKELSASVSREPQDDRQFQDEKDSARMEPSDVIICTENSHPLMPRITSIDRNYLTNTSYSNGSSKELIHDQNMTGSGKQDLPDRSWTKISDEANISSWRFEKKDTVVGRRSMRGGSRWRSDESSEDEEDWGLNRFMGAGALVGSSRRTRNSRR